MFIRDYKGWTKHHLNNEIEITTLVNENNSIKNYHQLKMDPATRSQT